MVNSSKTAELGDYLVRDLETVLDRKFGYKGNVAHSENCPDAPNPLLTITDIGSISLPLSKIDAKRIITCATQAPFGLGTSTVIDKKVRDTWQIDPSLVSFRNPAWDSFLRSNIANICSGLGLPGGYDIQYKLHKLLLYETGSHFRPHQDTQKEDGMFATMVIVLPSQYTGGEIVVSHGSTSKVIDVSASCANISVLSWYTDVMHQVKPIKSGYRLVMSYNLIRRSLSRPEMHPTGDAGELGRLHQILERWRTGGYMSLPEQHMVAYVLGHQYSESDLNMGQDALKGQDAHKVNQIRWVAEMLGFELLLARFQLCVVFEIEDDSGSKESWTPRGWNERDCTLEYFVDLKGNRCHGKINRFVGLIEGDDEEDYMGKPDEQEFQRSTYKGNEPSTITNYYHRTALVIFNKEDLDRVMITICGVEYGLDKLQTSLKQENPTAEDKKIIDLLLHTRMQESNWKALAEFPLRFHDLDLWNKIIDQAIQRFYRALITLKEEMFLAWDMFGFQQVQSSYNAISKERYNGDTIDFIHEVKARAARLDEQEIVRAWCDKHIVAFMKCSNLAYCLGSEETSKTLVSIAKEDGVRFLTDFGGHSYPHEIARLFTSEKENIYASPANEPERNKGEDLNRIFEGFLDKCIRDAIRDLNWGGYLPSTETTSLQGKINDIFEVVELSIAINRLDQCATSLFRLIWDAKNDPTEKLMLYYMPITLHLRTRIPKLGTSLLSPPFATFARNVIGYYLSMMLGSKAHNPRPSLQMPPCKESCSTCTNLHEFLEQLYVPVQDFNASRKTREHFVKVLSQLSNFISFTEVTGGRYRVGKHRDFLNSHRWEYRLEQARNFLKSIGDDEFLEQLMGNRFEDLKVALEGKSGYNYTGYE